MTVHLRRLGGASLIALAACGPTKTSAGARAAAEADARTLAAHAEFDARLERMPTLKPRDDASERELSGLAADDAKRPSLFTSALAFRFVRLPPRLDAPTPPARLSMFEATFDADSDQRLIFGIELPETVRGRIKIVIARNRGMPPSTSGRAAIAKAWNLAGASPKEPYAPVVIDAEVLAHRVTRRERPAAFVEPGVGTWTLFRVVAPADGFIAIDWKNGVGEVMPKRPGERDELGVALYRAL